MAQFNVSGSGFLDLTLTDLSSFDGLFFMTTGNLTVRVTAFQIMEFGTFAVFTGSGFRDTVEVFASPGQEVNGSRWILNGWTANRDGFQFFDLAENDTITGSLGNDTVSVTQGINTVNGALGDDLLVIDWSDDIHSFANLSATSISDSTNTQVNFSGFERFDITLGTGSDNISTGAGNDTIDGGLGNDTLNSGTGLAQIDGGDGTDMWVADFSLQSLNLTVDVRLAGVQAAGGGTTYANLERLNLTGSSGNDFLASRTNNANDGLADSLNGGFGNDTLVVGGGIDTVAGGDGDDLLVIDWSTDIHSFANLSATSISDSTNTQVNFSGFERFDITLGTGSDNISTGAGNDTIDGGLGNDTLNSGTGLADVTGGDGTDLWVADFTGVNDARVIDLNLVGRQSAGNSNFYEQLERLSITGSNGNDFLASRTNNANDGLADSLNGGFGNDTLVVGGGIDTVDGGDGDDLLIIDWSTDNNRFINLSAVVFSDASNTQVNFVNIERFDIRLGLGDDNITTGDGNDTIRGGAGNDALNGGNGIDALVLTDAAGAVTVNFSSATVGTASGLGTGNDSFQNFERIDLGAFNDTVNGGTGANELNGNGGRDRLFGGDGNDTMNGGSGADRLVGGRGLDLQTGGTGADTFVFSGTRDSGDKRDTADILTDFEQGDDIIDLGSLNSNAVTPADPFQWLGTAGFTGVGQARYYFDGGNTFIELNTGGTNKPEMVIRLDGEVTLSATDFIL